MSKKPKLTTILDLSKGFGYGLLYNPVIGHPSRAHFPLIFRFRQPFRSRRFPSK